MQDAMTWFALVASLGSITTFVTFWFRIGGKLQGANDGAEAAKTIASAALAKVDLLSSQLSEFRVEVARDFASANDLKDVERRLVNAVDNLGARFDRMAERLDRFLDRHSQ
jgi:hypothetical protein